MGNKKIKYIRHTPDGDSRETEICTAPTEYNELHQDYIEQDFNEEGHDDCTVCNENLFFNRNITKRIAILEADKSISGWVCPSCYTEFDSTDKVVVLMSKSNVQGRA